MLPLKTLQQTAGSGLCSVCVVNHQTVHHLFPGIIQSHYPKIRPIIAETCKEFGVRYNHTDEGPAAIGEHLGHLRRLGQAAMKLGSKKED